MWPKSDLDLNVALCDSKPEIDNSSEIYVFIVCGLAAVVFLSLFTCGAKFFLKRDIGEFHPLIHQSKLNHCNH